MPFCVLLLTLGMHVSMLPLCLWLRRVTSLLQHWDISRVVAKMPFPFLLCHNEVMQMLITLFVSERSYLNDSVGFPQGQRVWGSVILL